MGASPSNRGTTGRSPEGPRRSRRRRYEGVRRVSVNQQPPRVERVGVGHVGVPPEAHRRGKRDAEVRVGDQVVEPADLAVLRRQEVRPHTGLRAVPRTPADADLRQRVARAEVVLSRRGRGLQAGVRSCRRHDGRLVVQGDVEVEGDRRVDADRGKRGPHRLRDGVGGEGPQLVDRVYGVRVAVRGGSHRCLGRRTGLPGTRRPQRDREHWHRPRRRHLAHPLHPEGHVGQPPGRLDAHLEAHPPVVRLVRPATR